MNIRKSLKTFATISAIFFCGTNAYAQISGGGAIIAVDERTLVGGGKAEINSPVSSATAQSSGKAKRNSGGKKSDTTNKKATSAKTTEADSAKTSQNIYKKATPKTPALKKYDGFVIGDKYTFLNFEIVKAAQPIHTIAAQDAGAKGLVQVEILIGENGKVLEARARSGNKLLHPEAERAALATVFNKPAVYGKPARAFGFIVFRFGESED